MKRILAVLLAAAMCLGMGMTAMAKDNGNKNQLNPRTGQTGSVVAVNGQAPLGYSAQGTRKDQGAVSTVVGGTLNKNDTFELVFNAAHFEWAGAPGGNYAPGKFDVSWIKISNTAFAYSSSYMNAADGSLVVALKAVATTSDPLSIWLDSSLDGSKATNRFTKTITVVDPIASPVRTRAGGTAPSCMNFGSTVSLRPGDKLVYNIPMDNFDWEPAGGTKNPLALTDKSWIKLSGATVDTDFEAAYSTPSTSTGDVQVTLTALRTGTYSSLQLYLQSPGGAATTASARQQVTVASANTGTINGIADDARLGGRWSDAILDGKSVPYSDLSTLEVRPGGELLMPFSAGFFTWSGEAPYSGTAVTESQLKSGKVKVAMGNRKGGNAFASGTPKIISKNGRAYVQVLFAETNRTVKDQDFEMTLYLTVNESRHTGSELALAGTLVQDVYEVDGPNEYVDISDGAVVEATNYARNTELYLGAGVTMYANLMSGRKYSGTAKYEISRSDEALMDKFPSIVEILVLKVVNLDKANSVVTFDMPERYYVYNADGKFLGRSNERLPFSTKYYFSTKSIEMVEDDDYDDEFPVVGDDYVEPGQTGGWTESPDNANDNPGTGC